MGQEAKHAKEAHRPAYNCCYFWQKEEHLQYTCPYLGKDLIIFDNFLFQKCLAKGCNSYCNSTAQDVFLI